MVTLIALYSLDLGLQIASWTLLGKNVYYSSQFALNFIGYPLTGWIHLLLLKS